MWIETIVMPREDAPPPPVMPARDRAARHAAACAEGEHFRDSVLSYLKNHQLMDAVQWISTAGSVPLVTLLCTSLVLEQLQKEPSFEAGRALSLPVY